MKKRFLASLLLLTYFSNDAVANIETGLYCESCSNINAAKTFLRDSGLGPTVECNQSSCFPSPPEIIQVGNGRHVYTLKASRTIIYPHTLEITENNQPLNVASYQELYQTWEEFKQFVFSHNLYVVPSSIPELTSNRSDVMSTGEQCPDTTAAKALTNPNLMDHIFQKAEVELATGLGTPNHRQLSEKLLGSNMVLSNGAMGGVFKGVNVSASISKNDSNQTVSYIAEFSETEVNASVSDRLVFTFDYHGLDANNIPVMNMKLIPGASRIGGKSLSVLSGNFGTAFIDNECLQNSLKRFKHISSGTFESSQVDVNDIPHIPPGQDREVQMCQYYFNQPGVYSMTWYAPCN
ncbi:hypothetical protein PULV_b0568 [Pseudoalteromonas ulvae UL12]|uniref:hypothetical protein n=1 Tax=Pseudoalteromonas ulvae TaxID=107327 RepID=UPI00186B61CC|nr:hypothetical protein [Pseudoalteromonas ulvae]MBE0365878.1 hypothetical protein [Pseudoalteromonas ulvae UL12]